jgi:Flp pilus assembly pilin Flp
VGRELAKFIQDESGQAVTEYMLILAFAVSVAGALSRRIVEALDKALLKLGSSMERMLKTGRAPAGIWTN